MSKRQKLTKREFEDVASDEALKHFSRYGFSEIDPGAFCQECYRFLKGFGFNHDRAVMRFCVPVGIEVTAMKDKDVFIMQSDYHAFCISYRLGTFRNNLRGAVRWYCFWTERELRDVIANEMYPDFVEQALPWLEQFKTLDDVVTEYFRWRIQPKQGAKAPPSDPFGWASYGWMLEELGRHDEARPWLMKAYEEFCNPRFINKYGQFVPKGTCGAKPHRQTDEEIRAIELLRQSLGLPIPK